LVGVGVGIGRAALQSSNVLAGAMVTTKTVVPPQDFKQALPKLSFFIIPFHSGSGGFDPW